MYMLSMSNSIGAASVVLLDFEPKHLFENHFFLHTYDLTKPFLLDLHSDSSDYHLGGVLSQEG